MLTATLSLIWTLLSWLFSPYLLAVVVAVVSLLYLDFTRYRDFWKSRGVRGPTPRFLRNSLNGNVTMIDVHDYLYNEQGGKKYCGYLEFQRPVLSVGDPDLIRNITVKDFEHFPNRRDVQLTEEFKLMMSALKGKEWKETRSVMTPTFSASKLKAMHQLCLDNADKLSRYLAEDMERNGTVEIKEAFGRFTMDNIASCAFGVNCNSFTDPNTEFARNAGTLFRPPKGYVQLRLLILIGISKRLAYLLPDPYKASCDFFRDVVDTVLKHRAEHGTSRRDYLQLLLETKDKDGNRILTQDSITAQCVLFFIAGYDTTATLLTFAAYSLATSPDCQRKAQEEADQVLARHNGEMTYDTVSEMTYLDRVLSEALRLYSPAIALERECAKDYILPGTDVQIPAGTLVQIPVLAIHRDPEYYPDPLKFDPDRFLPEEKEKRHPCVYLPFGSGPRNCIAMRFALFEAKVALAAVLRDFTLEPGPDTPPPPIPLDKSAFLTVPQRGTTKIRVVARNPKKDQ